MSASVGLKTYVDWNDDGDFNDAYEQMAFKTRIDRPLAGERGRDQVRMLAPPMAGTSTMVADNEAKEFSPENSSSPLAGDLVPGHLVRQEARLWNTEYLADVMLDAPVGYWRLGDSGLEAKDWSGNGLTGTVIGTSFASTTGIGGAENGSNFFATNGRVQMPASPLLNLTASLSIEAWVKTTDLDTFIWGGHNAGGGYSLEILTGTGVVRFVYGNPTTALASPGAINDGYWHHVVGTTDGITARLYVDGAQVASASATPNGSYAGTRNIGASGGSTNFFDGRIDEVAVYSTALPALRVASHYQKGRPSGYRAQVLADTPSVYWRMDELSGTTLADSSGNGRNATIAGAGPFVLGLDGAVPLDVGTAISFNGAAFSSRASIADAAWQDQTSFTVECWLFLEGYGTTANWRVIYQKNHPGGTVGVVRNYGLWLQQGTEARLHISWTTGGGATLFSVPVGDFQFEKNRWYHTALVVDDTTKLGAFYVDGDLLAQSLTPYTGSPDASTAPLYLGGTDATTYPALNYDCFPGRVDEFAFYPTALSGQRLWEHYQEGIRGRYTLSTNVLDDLPQQPEWNEKSTTLPALGTLAKLRAVEVSLPLYTNLNTADAIRTILTAAGVPESRRRIHLGATTLLYFWANKRNAFDLAQQVLHTEGPGAALYEDEWGCVVFEGRQYRLAHPRSTTSQATFGTPFSPPYRLEALSYNPGLKNIVNQCTAQVNVRAPAALTTLWTLGTTLSLAASESRVFKIALGDPIWDAIVPVNATDYTVTAGSLSSVSFLGFVGNANGGEVTLRVVAGAGGATVTGLQVRGQLLAVARTIGVQNNVNASASIATHGLRSFPYEIWPEIDYLVAQDYCDAVVNAYMDPRPIVTIQVPVSVGGVTGKEGLRQKVSNRVGVFDTQLAMNMEAHVEKISYEWRNFHLYMNLGVEKASTGTYAVWGTAQWDLSRWAF